MTILYDTNVFLTDNTIYKLIFFQMFGNQHKKLNCQFPLHWRSWHNQILFSPIMIYIDPEEWTIRFDYSVYGLMQYSSCLLTNTMTLSGFDQFWPGPIYLVFYCHLSTPSKPNRNIHTCMNSFMLLTHSLNATIFKRHMNIK